MLATAGQLTSIGWESQDTTVIADMGMLTNPVSGGTYDTSSDTSLSPDGLLEPRALKGGGGWTVHPTGWGPGKLASHYQKHNGEWGPGLTEEEYDRIARRLLNSTPDGRRIIGYTRAKAVGGAQIGDIVRYDRVTNTFAVMRSDGTIVTCFRPVAGIIYYEDDVAEFGSWEARFGATTDPIFGPPEREP